MDKFVTNSLYQVFDNSSTCVFTIKRETIDKALAFLKEHPGVDLTEQINAAILNVIAQAEPSTPASSLDPDNEDDIQANAW